MLNNLHIWVFVKWELKELKIGVKESQVPGICKMGIKRIKNRSQRITSSGYLKKIQNQRTAAAFGYFKKTSQNCRVSQKPGKEEPCRFLGNYFTFTI
jgi:hypothetical protein